MYFLSFRWTIAVHAKVIKYCILMSVGHRLVQGLASVGERWSWSKGEIPLVPVNTDRHHHQRTSSSYPTPEVQAVMDAPGYVSKHIHLWSQRRKRCCSDVTMGVDSEREKERSFNERLTSYGRPSMSLLTINKVKSGEETEASVRREVLSRAVRLMRFVCLDILYLNILCIFSRQNFYVLSY